MNKVWLHYSLNSLNKSLNGNLQVYKGDYKQVLLSIIKKNSIEKIYWNNCYHPWMIESDNQIKEKLKEIKVDYHTCHNYLLWRPWQVKKKDETPYKVFSHFYYRGCLELEEPRKVISEKNNLSFLNDGNSKKIEDLNLLPKKNWYKKVVSHWQIGAKGAKEKLKLFLENGLSDYKEGRDFPKPLNQQDKVSRLSTHLHFGEISVNEVWYSAKKYAQQQKITEKNIRHFCSELGWREFSYYLLFHFPKIETQNLQGKFDKFEWDEEVSNNLKNWQKGKTGIPIVDAGMRQLWQTGYIHNRVRMIVASFLVKNLQIHWKRGEEWFRNCLFDANIANNCAGWQWVAGSGADAAPYFRIFNCVVQGEKFDASGEYTRHYVPELKNLPDKYLFKPWEAPKEILEKANIELGKDYPFPIVDLKKSREIALEKFQALKK